MSDSESDLAFPSSHVLLALSKQSGAAVLKRLMAQIGSKAVEQPREPITSICRYQVTCDRADWLLYYWQRGTQDKTKKGHPPNWCMDHALFSALNGILYNANKLAKECCGLLELGSVGIEDVDSIDN